MNITEKKIFWDWNGTLLDDLSVCVSTMNHMLKKRNLPAIEPSHYKNIFGFPVIDYYNKLGFDFAAVSFEDLSIEFIEAYNSALPYIPLVYGVKNVLGHFKSIGKSNIIISAMKHDMLLESVKNTGVLNMFDKVLGIDNIYAHSKSFIALDYVKHHNIDAGDIVFIGDTVHDFEVASDIGCRCILVADGHQSEERLRLTGAEIISSLTDLLVE